MGFLFQCAQPLKKKYAHLAVQNNMEAKCVENGKYLLSHGAHWSHS